MVTDYSESGYLPEERASRNRVRMRNSERPLSFAGSSSRLSLIDGPYSNCSSIDDLVNRFSRYQSRVRDIINNFEGLQIDDATQWIMNHSSTHDKPPLAFHKIHGTNVVLLNKGKVARRKESFCKGLAFSNRPVAVDENVCLQLKEVAINWSGVLRFGVTNHDPETFRNMPVPKFACPDLTAKDGYWAKALPERYSVEGNLLHFYVNQAGELYYGLNGMQKGLFLTGINTSLPMWLIVDIYGNSVALEFIDASEFRPSRRDPLPPPPPPPSRVVLTPSNNVFDEHSSTSRLAPSVEASSTGPMKFHRVTGRHITLNAMCNEATRDEREYTQGYVFTERPIKNNEKITIMVKATEKRYTGGLAFGLTCCDPMTLRDSNLPDDSADLIEMPDYWVGIKDIALKPKAGTKLSFWITDNGEVKFAMDDGTARTVLHCDNTLQLYFYFDVYGSTLSIRMLGCEPANRTASPSTTSASVSRMPSTIPMRSVREAPPVPSSRPPRMTNSPSAGLRVNIGSSSTDSLESSTRANLSNLLIDDLLGDDIVPTPPPVSLRPKPAVPPSRPSNPYVVRLDTSTPPISRPPSFPAPRPPIATASASVLASTTSSREPPKMESAPATVASSSSSSNGQQEDSDENECLICMEEKVNSVLYTCGHMCMCFVCATQLKENSQNCPLCRGTIKDVIKFFKS